MALRWGIASAGKIAHDFVTATQALPSSNHQVVAVAARSQASADKFAQEHNISKAYEGYGGLAQDPNIQVVYIGVLNPQHFEVSKLMLEAGKHVLCEKPFTMNEKQTRKLVEIAREKQLFLMEAVWSRCFPVYREMRKVINADTIGDVLHVGVEFGFPLSHVDRLKSKDMGGGSILDLGIYILQFQQYVFRGINPIKVVASGHLNESGTDDSVSAIITYPGGKTAVVTASAAVKLQNEARVYGSKGTITIPTFWCPLQLNVDGKIQDFLLPSNKGTYNYHNSAGLGHEAEEVRRCLLEGKIESPQITHEETIQLAQLMDMLRKQVGVVFPSDAE